MHTGSAWGIAAGACAAGLGKLESCSGPRRPARKARACHWRSANHTGVWDGNEGHAHAQGHVAIAAQPG
eukprot:7785376-Alexandrium_andersonii.AAC.1